MKYIRTLKSKIIISFIPGLLLGYAWGTTIYLDAPVQSAFKLGPAIFGFLVGLISSLILLYIISFIDSHCWKNSYRLNRFKIILFIVLFILSIFPVLNFNSGDSHIGLPFPFLVGWQRDLPNFPLYFLSLFVDRGEFLVSFFLLKLFVDLVILYTLAVLIALKLKRY
jgi:hypothetical protein